MQLDTRGHVTSMLQVTRLFGAASMRYSCGTHLPLLMMESYWVLLAPQRHSFHECCQHPTRATMIQASGQREESLRSKASWAKCDSYKADGDRQSVQATRLIARTRLPTKPETWYLEGHPGFAATYWMARLQQRWLHKRHFKSSQSSLPRVVAECVREEA